MPPKNQVFARRVKDEQDVPGMIAYCFYKLHKREYCQRVEETHERDHTPEDMDQFALTITDMQLENYRKRALIVIETFLSETIAQSLTEEVEELGAEYRERLENHVNALKPVKLPGFWYGVSQGVMASFLFVLFVGIIAFLLKALSIDIAGIAKAIGEYLGKLSSSG